MKQTILNMDCIAYLSGRKGKPFDLIFADPPFNTGYDYHGEYRDKLKSGEYLQWCKEWIFRCKQNLSATGSMWIAIGDEFAAQIKIAMDDEGFHMRNWVIWHYRFGTHCKDKFGRCHTHLLYYVKDKKRFVFNDLNIRVPSLRQTKYGDRRADSKGKVPSDVWDFPRVCGTFHERTEHPCQMPEEVLDRIVLTCSNPGMTVFDPFIGSGTTLASAKRLGRAGVGTETSEKFCGIARDRLAKIKAKR